MNRFTLWCLSLVNDRSDNVSSKSSPYLETPPFASLCSGEGKGMRPVLHFLYERRPQRPLCCDLGVLSWVFAPVGDLFQTLPPGMFKKPNQMSGMLEFVDIGPNLGLPTGLVSGCLATGCAAGV